MSNDVVNTLGFRKLLDTVIRQRDESRTAVLAAERDRDYYLRLLREWANGVYPSMGLGAWCANACSDGTGNRWLTLQEWRDAALKAEKELEKYRPRCICPHDCTDEACPVCIPGEP